VALTTRDNSPLKGTNLMTDLLTRTPTHRLLADRLATAWKVYEHAECEELKTALLVRIEDLNSRIQSAGWLQATS